MEFKSKFTFSTSAVKDRIVQTQNNQQVFQIGILSQILLADWQNGKYISNIGAGSRSLYIIGM